VRAAQRRHSKELSLKIAISICEGALVLATARGARCLSSSRPRARGVSPSRSSTMRNKNKIKEGGQRERERERERESVGREYKKHGFSGRYGILSVGRMFGLVRSIGRPYRAPVVFFPFFSRAPVFFLLIPCSPLPFPSPSSSVFRLSE